MKKVAVVIFGYVLFLSGMYILYRGAEKMLPIKNTVDEWNEFVFWAFTMIPSLLCTIPGIMCITKFGKKMETFTFVIAFALAMYLSLHAADIVLANKSSSLCIFEAMTSMAVLQCLVVCGISFEKARSFIAGQIEGMNRPSCSSLDV